MDCQHTTTFFDVDETKCRSCGRSLTFPPRAPAPNEKAGNNVVVGREGPRKKPPSLICTCCQKTLPATAFNSFARNVHRGGKANLCRVCDNFRQRVYRLRDPEGYRRRTSANQTRFLARMSPDEKRQYQQLTPAGKQANAEADKRRRARQQGRPVMLQRAGRPAVHIKQICRVSASCPLRKFCTTD